MAMGLGAITIGLAALLFARLADGAGALFERGVHAAWWLPLIVTPMGFAGVAWLTRKHAPEAAGSGIPQVIAATHDPKQSLRRLISLRIAVLRPLFPGDPGGAVMLLGMVAYFTGVVRAPLTAVIIIVEATASRGLILPLFLSALIAHSVSALVCKERLYHGLSNPWRTALGADG
ncbi:chloride channel protein [Sphingomonas sp. AR_OL41]|uniref:chloride channel protein n=1 Tax=Sphingomonas sp. AR_OL41 TaxID=3042729 RepID=UPI00247FF627|nr:chloride channel protein [Sphingomonas sp. AR_OL41]MDH7975556.1 chloride channel protein [Sphingomonas sp. AR_OL41]